jgi:hypothetical protein
VASVTDKEAMKLALFALDIVKINYTQSRHINEAITALKEQLAQRTEQNFCSRCGKRTPDLITIHTCTPPPQESA